MSAGQPRYSQIIQVEIGDVIKQTLRCNQVATARRKRGTIVNWEASLVAAVIEEHFESAEDLLRALGRLDSRWSPNPTNWVFRGQGDADWKLQPRAFRPSAWKERSIVLPADSNEDQMKREWIIVQSFLQELNNQGLPLPGGRGT